VDSPFSRSRLRPTRRDLLSLALSLGAAGLAGCAGNAASPAPAVPVAGTSKKKLLLLGGTGFLGPAIVETALAHGHEVTLFHRGKTHPELFPNVEKIHGDRNESLDALKGRSWDVVYDTSGYFPKQVVRAAEALKGHVGQYVFVSSVSVYHHPSKNGVDEKGPVGTTNEPDADKITETNYGPLKALCEDAARAAFGDDATIVRPGLIVGPGDPTDRFTYWPVRLERGGETLAPGDGKDPAQIIDVRDLGAWLVTVAEGHITGTFNTAGPKGTMTMAAMLDAIKRGVGGTSTFTWVSPEFLEEQKVSAWMDMPVWVPSSDEDAGISRAKCDKAIAKGLTFRPVEDTARDTLAYWKTLPEARRAKPRAGLPVDKEAAVLEAWHKRSQRAPG
jgi:2'-hydroxyisoflavone reductase